MIRKFVYLVPMIAFSVLGASPCNSDEPVDAFLEALQERGHFDLALRYLERMARSELAPESLQEDMDYRRGMLLMGAARTVQNPTLREQRLDEAEQPLSRFIAEHPDHPSAPGARSQLGNVLVERARSLLTRAEREPANHAVLAEQASEMFDQAHELFLQSQQDIAEQWKPLNGSREREEIELRESLQSQYILVKFAAAQILFEQADALKNDQAKATEKLTEAAAAFEEIAQKYRNTGAGLSAVLYEGECYQRLGEHQRALSYFRELSLIRDNSPQLRLLKTKALSRAVESWLTDKESGHERAIDTVKSWLAAARGDEDEDPAWTELRLGLARAYHQKSTASDNEKESARALNDARELAEEVAKRRGPWQEEAQQLLVSLGRAPDQAPTAVVPQSASSFAEARDAAKQLINSMKLADTANRLLQSQIDKISDPAARQELVQRQQEAQKKSSELARQATALFERAVLLAKSEDTVELNGVRYFLSYLYYSQGDYRRAAVLASFVATRYPDSVAARECANVALAAHQQIYQQLDPPRREAQAARLVQIAELMISKWPEASQASTALTTLLDVTIQRGDLVQAEKYLERMPEDSPLRADAELRMGQAMWATYLQNAVAQSDDDDAQSAAESEALKANAKKLLSQGIERVGPTRLNQSTVRSALSLAQIYTETGEPERAVKLLFDPNFGAMTLLDRDSPLVRQIPGLEVEAYRTAIRAHVSAAAVSADAETSLSAARELLDRLRKQLEDQPDGQQQLIRIYVGLARDLERQLTVATPETKRALSEGFETFLRGAAQETADVSVLNWVAETFYSLGKGLEKGDASASKRYFGEAASAYERILQLAREKKTEVSAQMLTQIRVRLAITQRALGRYSQALDLLSDVLRQRGKVLDFQVEAAKTFQAWGDAGNSAAYLKAVRGDRPDNAGRNLIWGWAHLAYIVGRPELLDKKPVYRRAFHEARYNIALCHYKYALLEQSARRELLQRAKHDIVVTYQLYPNMGDAQRTRQYESLLKSIQQSLGEKVTGLAEVGE